MLDRFGFRIREIDDRPKWYALFVATGQEDDVKERLKFRFDENELKVLVPKRKMRERKNGKWDYKLRILFPGYVLLNGRIQTDEYYRLKDIPGVIKLLKDKYDPLEIDESEIEIIGKLICNNEVIGISDVYVEGGRISVIDGPLVGMEGLIKAFDRRKGRVKLLLNLLGEPRVVELSVSMVQPA